MKKIFRVVALSCTLWGCDQIKVESSEQVFKDKTGIVSIRNPPVSDIGRKVSSEEFGIHISNDFGQLVRIETQMIGQEIYKKKIAEGGIPALLNEWFDSGYFPYTYGATKPPSTILSREYLEIDNNPVLFVSLFIPGGSVLTVNGKRKDSKRYFAAFMDSAVCVMVAFEINTLDAEPSSSDEEKSLAHDKMIALIRSIGIDHEKVPKEK